MLDILIKEMKEEGWVGEEEGEEVNKKVNALSNNFDIDFYKVKYFYDLFNWSLFTIFCLFVSKFFNFIIIFIYGDYSHGK